MHDLLIATYVSAAYLLGLLALRALWHRSLSLSLAVCAIAGAGSLAITSFLGRQVVAGSKALVAAIRAPGDAGGFSAPSTHRRANSPNCGRDWARPAPNSPHPGSASMPWRPHGVNWWRGSRTISAPRW